MESKGTGSPPVSEAKPKVKIAIDSHSGFCFGVVRAIETAEKELDQNQKLYSLGDIVHNTEEVMRLKKRGMIVINHNQIPSIPNQRLLIRAHGEPPTTYAKAQENNIGIIDATCAVVLQLQQRVRKGFIEMQQKSGQVVIFGKKGHAEVVGLVGQTDNTALVISDVCETKEIDFHRPLRLYAQTTQSLTQYEILTDTINQQYQSCGFQTPDFIWYDTICRQVSNREESLKTFAQAHEVIIFVSDEKSSNGMVLYKIARSVNNRSHFISKIEELETHWFSDCRSIGICGATSTPFWLMEKLKDEINQIVNK